ncbi:hypothetical protein VTJ04DRAFT_6982 [Mycothermus thermophilus]
MDESLSCFTM